MPCNTSSEENLYLYLVGMIFDNAVKASVHGDIATECQSQTYRYIKESHFRTHSLIKQASCSYNIYYPGSSYENIRIFFQKCLIYLLINHSVFTLFISTIFIDQSITDEMLSVLVN